MMLAKPAMCEARTSPVVDEVPVWVGFIDVVLLDPGAEGHHAE